MITGQNALPTYDKRKRTEHQHTTNGRSCDMGINSQIHQKSAIYQKAIWYLVIVANIYTILFKTTYIWLTEGIISSLYIDLILLYAISLFLKHENEQIR